MDRNYWLISLFGISACFVASSARQAIIGGHIAKIHDFQYEVTLQHGNLNICGGGIIDKLHVLSAAHCVVHVKSQFVNKNITIIAGTHDLRKTDKPAIKVMVTKIFIPKEYDFDDTKSSGDIAVLKLQHPFDFKKHKHLKPLELPKKKGETFTSKFAKIAGFGWDWVVAYINKVHRVGGNADTRLRYADTYILSTWECHKQYQNATSIASEKLFCARVEQEDIFNPSGVCTGDSGSPLVYDENTVIGILSAGPPDCSEKIYPGLYTSVSHYLELIEHAKHDKPHEDIRTHELHP